MSEEERKREEELEKKAKQHIGIKAVFHEPSILLITIAFSLIKSVIYGLLLWVFFLFMQLPMYFYDIGLEKYETAIPITYDVASIIGSIGLGYIFAKVKIKSYILAPAMAILVFLIHIERFHCDSSKCEQCVHTAVPN